MSSLADYWRMYRSRGLSRIWDQVAQVDWFDVINGTSTSTRLTRDQYSPDIKHLDHGVDYQPAFTQIVSRTLCCVRETIGEGAASHYKFVDFGAGKGKVLIMARRLLGCRVTGVEYNADLIDAARHNLQVCGISDAELFCGDAAEFTNFGEHVICFAYNPFDAEVFAAVLRNLEKTMDVLFIYNNPVHADLFSDWRVVAFEQAHHPNWRWTIYRRQFPRGEKSDRRGLPGHFEIGSHDA